MEEPRKPFKTISLEDRWKASTHSTGIGTPQPQTKEGIVLKSVPEIDLKQATTLKTYNEKVQPRIQTPSKFITTPLLNSATPLIRSQFATNISLVNRLDQVDVTSTKHLPQYFLSDQYTGYLVIAPFLTSAIQDTQNIGNLPKSISEYLVLKNQDALVVLKDPLSERSTLVSQGTYITNEIHKSFVDLTQPAGSDSILLLQGTFVTNNQFISTTILKDVVDQSVVLARQGTYLNGNTLTSFVDPNSSLSITQINQGSIELPIYTTNITQGITTNERTPLSVDAIAILQGITRKGTNLFSGTLVVNNAPTLQLENSPIPTLDTQTIVISSQTAFNNPAAYHGEASLELVAYLSDRTLAFIAPRIKHGTAIIDAFVFDPNLKANQSPNIGDTFNTISLENSTTPIIDPDQIFDPIKSGPISAGLGGDATSATNLVNRYLDAAYGQIGQQSNRTKKSNPNPWTPAEPGAAPALNPSANNSKDFIIIRVGDVSFRAFLTSYTDGFSANWSDLKYVGRQDTLKQFTGTSRSVSFSILLPSFSKSDLRTNMSKLERVLSQTVVGSYKGSYLIGPLKKLRIGNLINSYVAFSSVKWDFDPAEATFDIDEQMPHLLKVSFDGAVLATNNDKLLDGSKGGYLGKSYA